ncbi:MAG: nucleotidyltransferase family protein [Gemmatimonadaceae bacterium]
MIVGLLLAAGGSRRFGSQKLMTPVRGLPLIRHGAQLLGQTTDHVIAVIGSDSLVVRAALDGTGAEIVENPEWREGLSTSLRRGVASVSPLAEAVVVALADQPDVRPDIVRKLIDVWRQTAHHIVTARYRGVRAPPVLLSRPVFRDVAALVGDVGAKAIMDQYPDSVVYVDIDADPPKDIDSPGDVSGVNS